ncbi:hypothetical protein FACS1894184_03090 [Clostridia bacterium]|nr:hypothetical protein FACS1894184_03090 [Clostridia bacterium]
MSKDRTMLLRFKLRRGTAATLYARNEIPLRGEPVIEMDSKLFKVGNGINSYNDLEYSNRLPHVAAAAPLTTDTAYPIGTLWINTAATPAKVHILVAKSATATWRQFVHPEDLASLGMGDMLKLTYDTNDDGKVNAADEADKLANAVTIGIIGDATGSATGDLSANLNIDLTLANSGVTAGTYPKVTVSAKGIVTGGSDLGVGDIPDLTLAKITDAGSAASKDVGIASGNVPILDASGKLASSVLPDISGTHDTFSVTTKDDLITLTTADVGDTGVIPDGEIYRLFAEPATLITNWVRVSADPNTVISVNGQSGPSVVLTSSDIAESGDNQYYTTERATADAVAAIAAAVIADLSDGDDVLMSTDTYILDGGEIL